MTRRIVGLFVIVSSIAFSTPLFAGTNDGAVIATHVSAVSVKSQCPGSGTSQDPNTLGIPCSDYDTQWPVATANVFLVAAKGTSAGTLGLSCGLEYGSNLFVNWQLCADGLEFPNDGGNGPWPASLGGNRILWATCQNTVIASDGVHAVAGYFYVYAYGGDRLQITPNNNIVAGPELTVTDCASMSTDLLGSVTGAVGFGFLSGTNPCTIYEITSVTDVGNDQGRQVRIRWNRNANDDALSVTPITFYSIWRKINASLAAADVEGRDGRRVSRLSFPPGEWEFVTSIPASGELNYAAVVPTLCDSTEAGICWSNFLVRGQTAVPTTFEDTAPDSGYSVDNLAPSAPMSLLLFAGNLTWDPAPEGDFDYFTVYGSSVDHLEGSATLIDYTVSPGLDVSLAPYSFYHVTATDFSHNEGEASSTSSSTAVPEPGLIPLAYHLLQSQPNPHRAATVIGFDLPEPGPVGLRVFDVNGRLVKVLIDETMGAGRYTVSWRGDDLSGTPAAPGLYFYRLESPSYRETRKTLFLGG